MISSRGIAVPVLFVHCFKDQSGVGVEDFQVTLVYHLNLVTERLLKVELGWAPVKEDPLHLFIGIGRDMAFDSS
jgi:hypothetical protein